MNKSEFKGNLLSPLPVALVGANVDGRPNYLVIGYISPFNFGRHIFFSLYKERYTKRGIKENGTFSVNVPSEDLIHEIEICGGRSGRDFDKGSLFDTFYGELETAPLISECPINMECRVDRVLDYGRNEGIIGEVVKTYVDHRCLTDGKVDLSRVRPLVWGSGGGSGYYRLGERVEPEEEG